MAQKFSTVLVCFCIAFGCLLSVTGAGADSARMKERALLDPDFRRFLIDKRQLVKQLSEKHGEVVPQMVWDFFDFAEQGDWQTMTNLFHRIEEASPRKVSIPRRQVS
jgi:hypothetical protein